MGLASDIVLAAQSLVNEQFRLNINTLGLTVRNHLKTKLEKFKTAVQQSTFLSQNEKISFAELTPDKSYEVARGIILMLTQREIKSPSL